jgi:hypothetical protein
MAGELGQRALQARSQTVHHVLLLSMQITSMNRNKSKPA